MRRRMFFILAVVLVGGCATSNPNVQIGVGLAIPAAGTNIPTQATVNRATGTVDETQALDKSPQVIVEAHKTFTLGAATIGPMVGAVLPKVRIGESTENPARKDEPFGLGFGGVETFSLGENRRIHVGILWEFMSIDHLSSLWEQGKSAPRDGRGLPIDPSIAGGLAQRGLITVTVSGVFK